MSAEVELLREAARRLRAQAVDGNPNPWAQPEVDRRIADWLDSQATDLDHSRSRLACESPNDLDHALFVASAVVGRPECTCTVDPDGARNTDGCVEHDLPPCGFLVDEVGQ
ncbi:hypothetical protein AB0K35_28385 [Micromonospora sp. NPDC053740]|uniref:hypothetical protein n=1 Tax=Micromonospora sp. NPDC053740 TaxID=3155173 RepID=UPI0034352FBE